MQRGWAVGAAGLMLCAWSGAVESATVCESMRGAIIVSQDARKTFLGRVTSRRDRESIFNVTGRYGDPTSMSSIWNPLSPLGDQFNVNSPFNKFSGSPPLIIKDRKVMGYLSTNTGLRYAIAPQALKALCKDEL